MVEEGLHFGDGICPSNTMDLIEHFGRYAALAKFVKGQRVLDIACGKGYGSWLLKEWGASSVLGLDTSEEAIVAARREFSRDGVDFRVANAGDAVSALPTASFDLIACFDTIEHVDEPERFLAGLRSMAAPDARIFISCANDHVAYQPDDSNPSHLRKYTFEEFREFAERVLGPASQWLLGVNVQGYALVHDSDPLISPAERVSKAMFSMAEERSAAYLLPSQPNIRPDRANVLYYLGVWGDDEPITPVSVSAQSYRAFIEPRQALDWFKAERVRMQNDLEVGAAKLLEAKRQIIAQAALITRLGGDVRVRGMEEAVRLKDELQMRYDHLVQSRDELQTRHDAVMHSKGQLQAQYDAVVRSRSWRLTKPLRVLARMTRGDFGSVRQSLVVWLQGRRS